MNKIYGYARISRKEQSIDRQIRNITSFKMSPTSLGGGKQTTTAGEHISQLVETLIGRFFF